MGCTEAIARTLTVCASLRLSQAKTLSELVAGALRCGRISLAQIATVPEPVTLSLLAMGGLASARRKPR